MILTEVVLDRRGPLAKVWLAAHYEKKLNKKEIVSANIAQSVEAIVRDASVSNALRLTSQLLVGVVRIYSRKTKYLLDECNEALISLRMAFRLVASRVNLPGDVSLVHAHSITLNDCVTEMDLFMLPMLDICQLNGKHAQKTSQARYEDITLDESIFDLTPQKPRAMGLHLSPQDADIDVPIDLGFGFDDDVFMNNTMDDEIEVARRAGTPLTGFPQSQLLSSPAAAVGTPGSTPIRGAAGLTFGFKQGLVSPLHGDAMANMGDDLMFDDSGILFDQSAPRNNLVRRKRTNLDARIDIHPDYFSGLLRNPSSLAGAPSSHCVPATLDSVSTHAQKSGPLFTPLLANLGPGLMMVYEQAQKKAKLVPSQPATPQRDPMTQSTNLYPNFMVTPTSALARTANFGLFDDVDDMGINFSPRPLKMTPIKGVHENGAELNIQSDDEFHDDDETNKDTQSFTKMGFTKASLAVARELVEIMPRRRKSANNVDVSDFLKTKSRRDAARIFYELLLLNTRDIVCVQQSKPFGCISVSSKPSLYELVAE